ncbi:hypothetical protein H477_1297 [[Clostridium] sordellii ATCC 9714]|nr:hypothetical protein H477_1297 [[Clostridium] sordellii ATCC 9714] [Paeniclostridium sordellii ATCC 9714]
MKVNHIKDNLVDETSVNVITNEFNKNDYMYIKDLNYPQVQILWGGI